MTHELFRPARAYLSRHALESNISLIRKQIQSNTFLHRPSAKIMAMIKADAYGHDVTKILPALEKLGIKNFAVASLEEGIQARQLTKKCEILVLGGTLTLSKYVLEVLKKYRLHIAINSLESLKAVMSFGALPFHLKLDTGMNRLGIQPAEWSTMMDLLRRNRSIPYGLFTHFATAEDENFRRQVRLFEEAVRWFAAEKCRPHWVHSENSAALFGRHGIKRGLLSEVGNLVRPGTTMYGYSPRKIQPQKGLVPVLELVSEIGLIKQIEAGEGISYGHLYRAKRSHEFGVVPLGYADGLSKQYSQSLSPQLRSSSGRLKGRLNVCGAICMDMVMVRPVSNLKMRVGDSVVFWGRFPNPVLASQIVEPYELNLRISKRIPRVWVK